MCCGTPCLGVKLHVKDVIDEESLPQCCAGRQPVSCAHPANYCQHCGARQPGHIEPTLRPGFRARTDLTVALRAGQSVLYRSVHVVLPDTLLFANEWPCVAEDREHVFVVVASGGDAVKRTLLERAERFLSTAAGRSLRLSLDDLVVRCDRE